MTEERKGPGFSIPCCGLEHVDDLAHIPDLNLKIDPELKERLDASLVQVRGVETGRTSAAAPRSGAIPKTGRGLTKHIITMDDAGFCADVDENGYPIGNSREDHAERERAYDEKRIRFLEPGEDGESRYPDPITISATVNINSLDLENDMIAKGAKQIMAHELNLMFAEQGIKTHYTPEMLSALAAERLRAEQKRKKKARINKRKRK